jgi:hypothetical protein
VGRAPRWRETEEEEEAAMDVEGGVEVHRRNGRKATGPCLAGGPPCSPLEEKEEHGAEDTGPGLETMGRWRR